MKNLTAALKRKGFSSLAKQVFSLYEYSPYTDDDDREAIDKFYDKYVSPYHSLRKVDFMFFPTGSKTDLKSNLWFDAYYSPSKKELSFPRGWLYDMTEKRTWILVHEIGHAWHLQDEQVLKEFEPLANQMKYLNEIHSDKEQLLGNLFADAVAEYIIHPAVLKSKAREVYRFMKDKIK